MAKRIVKYNPAFLSKEELVSSFVVRQTELELIVQVLRENVTKSNQHVLVIGPRGIGKTMLVLRVVEEIRRDEDLSEKWYPLVFAEESYPVSTPGELWLEGLFHLGRQTGDEKWKKTYEELHSEQDEERLRKRALAQLMDFADAAGKRILVIVENFNMLVGDQISDDDAWVLRHTLLNERRVMLLATATSRFEGIENSDKAMFELFKLQELEPLNEAECGELWASVTGKETSDKRIRPVQIFTGGNPRLVAIISTFAARMSLKELMEDLMQLVDDNTDYFKSHLDSLPPIERKAYLALAELWDPVPARAVAKSARLDVSKTSALLRRLVGRGRVVEANGRGRTKLYQVSERMYNIYYLMRRRGGASGRVKAVVRFMVVFYGQKELISMTHRIAEEACELESKYREDHYYAYGAILESVSGGGMRYKLLEATPKNFFEMPDVPTSLKDLADERILALLKQADTLCEKPDKFKEAECIYRKAIEIAPQKSAPWAKLGQFLHRKLNRYEEAEKAYRKAIELEPENHVLWEWFGRFLHKPLGRYEESEAAYRKAIELGPNCSMVRAYLGDLLSKAFQRYGEAEKGYRKAVELGPDNAWAWAHFGELLHEKLERYEEAEQVYRRAIELEPKVGWGYAKLGQLLQNLDRYDEAESSYRKAIDLDEEYAWAWAHLGQLLYMNLDRPDEAEEVCRKAIELDPEYPCPWVYLGGILQKRGCYEEAERAYRKAIEKGLDCAYAWDGLIVLLLEKLECPRDAWQLAEKYLAEHPKNADLLNSLAWAFCRHGGRDYLARAEVWAKEALELAPEHKGIRGTLTSILSARGKGREALEHVEKFLSDPALVEAYVDEAIDQFVGIAASGYGREALKILVESPSAEILEPLVVGLRMFVGEDVKAATEIMEVGKDVVKRIEERREEIRKAKASSDVKKG